MCGTFAEIRITRIGLDRTAAVGGHMNILRDKMMTTCFSALSSQTCWMLSIQRISSEAPLSFAHSDWVAVNLEATLQLLRLLGEIVTLGLRRSDLLRLQPGSWFWAQFVGPLKMKFYHNGSGLAKQINLNNRDT